VQDLVTEGRQNEGKHQAPMRVVDRIHSNVRLRRELDLVRSELESANAEQVEPSSLGVSVPSEAAFAVVPAFYRRAIG
jgi:hypothetical protein